MTRDEGPDVDRRGRLFECAPCHVDIHANEIGFGVKRRLRLSEGEDGECRAERYEALSYRAASRLPQFIHRILRQRRRDDPLDLRHVLMSAGWSSPRPRLDWGARRGT